MHFVIMGCGRVGATLARELASLGHSVAIIDQDPEAFRKLPEDFPGQEITGVGFDRDVLISASIEDAAGFAAVSSGDNSNIIAARVARESFGVTNTVVRVYDPTRGEVFERLGFDTVPTVRWTVDQVLRRLIPLGPHHLYTDAISGISLIEADLDPSWHGHTVGFIESATQARVAYLQRGARGVVVTEDTIVQDGDIIKLISPSRKAGGVQHILMNRALERTGGDEQ
ncbi:potassium channel family protein [Actinobaculum massiliense]|nr:TrkA family potassium uptake protein [Actinobaculum massiliense]MDK8318239.1 TrkA family potassium uptake protein [Actinobaculum massiliense]MDK8566654.1 TrkA family potassium uptake protein [Actinobaculum massiliense]